MLICPIFSRNLTLLDKKLKENHIIIGYKTAQNYNLKVGEQIDFLVPEPGGQKKIFLKKKKAVVAGIFKIGLEEYDSNFAFTSLDFLRNLFDEKKGVDQICLKLDPGAQQIFLSDLGNTLKKIFIPKTNWQYRLH